MELLTNRIRQYLDENEVKYQCLPHRRDFTARVAAHDCHVDPQTFAKAVVLEADGKQLLAALPADYEIDLPRLKRELGAQHIGLIPESQMSELFPDCEMGAFPVLGNLYGLPVYVAPPLSEQQDITFNAGTHEEAISMPYADFERLVQPTVLSFACPAAE